MKFFKSVLVCLVFPLMSYGCDFVEGEKAESPTPVSLEAFGIGFEKKEAVPEPYTLYVKENEYTLSMYEPYDGCYLGAYIAEDKGVNAENKSEIKKFEELVKKPHAIYASEYKMGEPFPLNWVLDCIKNMKTPLVEISPEKPYIEIDYTLIANTAKAFGKFNIPMFIKLSPSKNESSPEAFKRFYVATRKAFSAFAPNCAFVFSVSSDDVFDIADYYPEDELVDWVGVDVKREINADGIYEGDIFKQIDYLYYTFQNKKPIMVSSFSASVFSSVDYSYKTELAKNEIASVYEKIRDEYSRIKAVLYYSIEYKDEKSKEIQNYKLTASDEVFSAYKNSVSSIRFLSEVDQKSSGNLASQWLMSPFKAVRLGKDYFISENSLTHDMQAKGVTSGLYSNYAKAINGDNFYNSSVLIDFRLGKYFADDENGRLNFYSQ